MSVLSEQQRQELRSCDGGPVPVVDEQSQKVYYLISSEEFARVRALLVEEPLEPREMYPLIAKTAGEAGWNQPAMDDYDRYDEQRDQS
jgi:hypothetical protein